MRAGVHIFAGIFIRISGWIFTLIASLGFIFVGLLVIWAVAKKEALLLFIEKEIISAIVESAGKNFEISLQQPEFFSGHKRIGLKTSRLELIDKVHGKFIILNNVSLSLSYLHLLKFRLSPILSVEKAQINLPSFNFFSIYEEKKGFQKGKANKVNINKFIGYLKYVSEIEARIKDLEVNSVKSSFYFQNILIGGRASSRNILSLNYFLKGEALQKDHSNGELRGSCAASKAKVKCILNAHGFYTDLLQSMKIAFFPNTIPFSYYLTIEEGDISYLNADFTFAEQSFSEINIHAESDMLKFSSPFLYQKKQFKSGPVSISFQKDKKELRSKFFLVLSDSKKIMGSFVREKDNFVFNIKGKGVKIEDIRNYWPVKYLGATRQWLINSVLSGDADDVRVYLNAPLKKREDLAIEIFFKEGTLRYSSSLPLVTKAKGKIYIDNSSLIKVNLESALLGENITVQKSLAVFDTANFFLKLKLFISGKVSSLIEFFLTPNPVTPFLNSELKGDFIGSLDFETYISSNPSDILYNAKYKGSMEVERINTPLFFSKKKASFIFDKKPETFRTDLKILGEANFSSTICIPETGIDFLAAGLEFDLPQKKINIYNLNMQGKNLELKGNAAFSYDGNIPPFLEGELSLKHCGNDFFIHFDSAEKNFTLTGAAFNAKTVKNLPIISFVERLIKYLNPDRKSKENHSASKKSRIALMLDALEYTALIQIEKLHLLNGVNYGFFSLKNSKKNLTVTSELINGYKTEKGLKFTIPSLEIFLKAAGAGDIPLRRGELTIESNEKQRGNFTLKNYELKVGGIDLSSKQLYSEFLIEKNNFLIKDFKLQNLTNTLALTGNISLLDGSLNLDATYTASSLDIINRIPFISELISTITFGNLKNGLLTLSYGIEGTIEKPKVIFKTYKTTKKLVVNGITIFGVVIGVNALLIPLLAILI